MEIFGEFTEDAPWQRRVPCKYDHQHNCFKVDVQIRIGHLFKFVVDDGRDYVVSQRYPIRTDNSGNQNNVYEPGQIQKQSTERKKYKQSDSSNNPYDIKKIVSDLKSEKAFSMSEKGLASRHRKDTDNYNLNVESQTKS